MKSLTAIGSLLLGCVFCSSADAVSSSGASVFENDVIPLLESHCLNCHSTRKQKGELDLEQFQSHAEAKSKTSIWLKVIEQVQLGEMPPKDEDPLTKSDRDRLLGWADQMLEEVALENAGDPGAVVLRRLSNAELTYTIRDLTGIENLDPAREFPTDSASGEGFMNVGQSLVMSPSMLEKYFDAAKKIAAHAVLTPTGIRFSPSVNRPDWQQENLDSIREFYARYSVPGAAMSLNLQGIRFDSSDGGIISLENYLKVALEFRESAGECESSWLQVAEKHGLSGKYLIKLVALLNQSEPGDFLKPLRQLWKQSEVGQAGKMVEWIEQRQAALWTFNPVGHIGKTGGPTAWQTPREPSVDELKSWVPAWQELELDEAKLRELTQSDLEKFRSVFPGALCYTRIVPVDEVVTLSLYYQEDHFLRELILSEDEIQELDQLWSELRFVSREAIKLVDVYDQLWQYATQDADPSVFEPLRKPIRDRAETFRQKLVDIEPIHLKSLIQFADQAYRRPLSASESKEISELYTALREEDIAHEEAVRLLIARVLVSPSFLYRLEQAPAGINPGPISQWELATRLSYFLWSSMPDQQLRQLADSGQLIDPKILQAEVARMLKHPKIRRLAEQFGCVWLNIYDFDQLGEKNETRHPKFADLRSSMYEEPIQFFTDLFQQDRSILNLIDSDYTFVNGALAEFYGIPNVKQEDWVRVNNVKSLSRGGVLGFAATLAKQSGATRTSPILRGAWLSETILGEKLPRPPKNVPQLPDDAVSETLSMRELTQRHTQDPRCYNCHSRIDPYGFALEAFSAIGEFRKTTDAGGEVETATQLMDGTAIEGIVGLKNYLGNQRKSDFSKQFCRKLLGFSLGRATQLSDRPLIEAMSERLEKQNFKVSSIVNDIVMSDQFQKIRGADFGSVAEEIIGETVGQD